MCALRTSRGRKHGHGCRQYFGHHLEIPHSGILTSGCDLCTHRRGITSQCGAESAQARDVTFSENLEILLSATEHPLAWRAGHAMSERSGFCICRMLLWLLGAFGCVQYAA